MVVLCKVDIKRWPLGWSRYVNTILSAGRQSGQTVGHMANGPNGQCWPVGHSGPYGWLEWANQPSGPSGPRRANQRAP